MGHVAERYVSGASCSACVNTKAVEWRKADPVRWQEVKGRFKERHPKYQQGLDIFRRPYISEFQRRRQAGKRNATPVWADLDAIRAKYYEAERLSNATGIKHHVDHIVPLRSRYACGLHVEDNLRAIPAHENQKKWAKFEPYFFTPEQLAMAAERLMIT